MRIAINTRFLLADKMEGFGWFTYEITKRMVINHPEHTFYFFFDRNYNHQFIFSDNVIPVVLNPPARHPILFKIWFNYSVTKALKKYKIDLFFSPDGYLSLQTKIPQIAVIHDLNFEHYPKDIPASPRRYLLKYFPLFAKKANEIITVSEFSKQDIIKRYQIKPNKISVVYNAANDFFKPLSENDILKVRNELSGGSPYFIYVGAIHPRKNINRLFEAFNAFKLTTNSTTKLVVVGENLWRNKSKSDLKIHDDIVFTGHIGIEKLASLVGASRALCLVSYFEGFGIPLVEAMQSNVPVLSGNLTALPEVCENSALLVNPYNVSEIASGLTRLDADEKFRLELKEKGLERSKYFSWNKSAKQVWDVIEKYKV